MCQGEAHLGRVYETSPEAPEMFAGVVPSTAGCSNLVHRKTSTPAALRLSDETRMDISNPGNTEFTSLFHTPSTKFEASGIVFALSTTLWVWDFVLLLGACSAGSTVKWGRMAVSRAVENPLTL